MTHEQRSARRQQIAEHVRDAGDTIGDAARLFGVSIATVRSACLEYRVKWPDSTHEKHVGSLELIAAMFDSTKSLAEIADSRNVSRQRVSRLFVDAVKAGIPIPRRTNSPQARAIRAGVAS